jgi:hypothetical protein
VCEDFKGRGEKGERARCCPAGGTVITLRQQNEKERLALLEFEDVLRKHKQRVEKQRRWAETQSSYRLCLERMIRDTMHQYALSLPHQYIYFLNGVL